MQIFVSIGVLIVSYLIGSIPIGLLIVKFKTGRIFAISKAGAQAGQTLSARLGFGQGL